MLIKVSNKKLTRWLIKNYFGYTHFSPELKNKIYANVIDHLEDTGVYYLPMYRSLNGQAKYLPIERVLNLWNTLRLKNATKN